MSKLSQVIELLFIEGVRVCAVKMSDLSQTSNYCLYRLSAFASLPRQRPSQDFELLFILCVSICVVKIQKLSQSELLFIARVSICAVKLSKIIVRFQVIAYDVCQHSLGCNFKIIAIFESLFITCISVCVVEMSKS